MYVEDFSPFTIEHIAVIATQRNGFLLESGKMPPRTTDRTDGEKKQNAADPQGELMAKFPWFVAQLRPQGLKLAKDHLRRQSFRTFAPEIEVLTVRNGKHRKARKLLFPGYIFVTFEPQDHGWAAINSTRGISRLILNDPRAPTALPDQLMAGILARCDDSGLLLPPPELKVGDEIRVLSGPFAELVTQIETLPDAARIGVLIDLLGRKVRTSIPRSQIEKLE